MTLDELEDLIAKRTNANEEVIDYANLPDNFSGPIPNGLRDVHFRSPLREQLHQRMLETLNNVDSATYTEQKAFFRYLRLITVSEHSINSGVVAKHDSVGFTSKSGSVLLSSLNPFESWHEGITDRILTFLEFSEAVALTALSCTFREYFWSMLSTFTCKNLVIGPPWHKCPVELRRLIFPRFSGVETLRIEPIASSVLVGEDLDDILRRSTRTLQQLYICAPCGTLLLISPLTTAGKGSGGLGSTSIGSLGMLSAADRSDSETIYARIDSAENIARPGCHCYRSLYLHPSTSFVNLRHIELTGNDAYLWAMVIQGWECPNLKSLTVQTWTDDFDFSEEAGEENDGSSYDIFDGTYYDGNVTMKDYQTGCCKEIVECKNIFWQRTAQCGKQRKLVFEALINKVSKTLWELELVVPGGITDDDFRYFQQGRSSSDKLDPLSRPSSYESDTVTPPAYERPKHVMMSIRRQFEDFCRLLRHVLFEEKNMKFLRKLEFLGLHNFSVAVYGLRRALEIEWQSKRTAVQRENIDVDMTSWLQKKTSDVERRHFLDPPFDNEPGQPYLPVLDFQDDWDYRKGLNMDCVELDFPDNIKTTDWPCISSPPIGRTLIVFSGTVQIPQKSCIEVKVLYPCCAEVSRLFIVSQHMDAPYDPFDEVGQEIQEASANIVEDQHPRYSSHPTYSLEEKPKPSAHANASRKSSSISTLSIFEKQVVMKLRMQQDNGALPPREFQRLQNLVQAARQHYLQPGQCQTTKRKPPTKKKTILAHREAPQDASVLLSQFSEAIIEFGMFLGDHTSSIRQLSVMKCPRLSSLRLVNWNGGNRSHLALFNLVNVSPPRRLHLTIETTDAHYLRIRRKNAKNFYTSLIHFSALLKARGMLTDRISFFPGPEESLTACMNYFFPSRRLHTAVPSRVFVDPFAPYGIPQCLFTVFPSDGAIANLRGESRRSSATSRAGEHVEEDEEEFIPMPPQIAINSQVLEVAAPLERGYSSIREFLVSEVERQSTIFPTGDPRSRPSRSSISVAWKDETSLETRLPTGITGLTYLRQALDDYLKGTFFTCRTECEDPVVRLTLSCHLGLVEFYRMIIGLRGLAACTFTERPFQEARIIMKFDQRRFGKINTEQAGKGDWLLETILLPWLTLVETFVRLTHCALVLLGAPTKSQPVRKLLTAIESGGAGVSSEWFADNDIIIVVLNPNEWNAQLCQWTLKLAENKLGESSLYLLKNRARM